MALNSKTIQRITGNTADSIINNNKHLSLDTKSFAERRQIDKNRTIIQGYHRSGVAQRAMWGGRSRTNEPEAASAPTTPVRQSEPGADRWSTNTSPSEAAWDSIMERHSSVYQASTPSMSQQRETNRFARPSRQENSRLSSPSRIDSNRRAPQPMPKPGGYGRI